AGIIFSQSQREDKHERTDEQRQTFEMRCCPPVADYCPTRSRNGICGENIGNIAQPMTND
ncbi:MAG: hypothetical protein VB876_04455, partial [Pirellulales bacterium]